MRPLLILSLGRLYTKPFNLSSKGKNGQVLPREEWIKSDPFLWQRAQTMSQDRLDVQAGHSFSRDRAGLVQMCLALDVSRKNHTQAL